jgi:hypothetical protein
MISGLLEPRQGSVTHGDDEAMKGRRIDSVEVGLYPHSSHSLFEKLDLVVGLQPDRRIR